MTTPRLDAQGLDAPPVGDPGPPPAPPASHPSRPYSPRGDRFFAWTAGLGIVRGDGWIGGVVAGLAARLRIDPLIVRGIVVVAALFGFPMLLVYALAWALLPDLDERIPLRDALRGRFEPAQMGILAFAIAGLIPFTPVLLAVIGVPSWMFEPGLGGWPFLSALAVGLGLVVVAGLVFIIVRAARATDPAIAPDQRTASAASATPTPSAAASGSGPDAGDADAQGVDAAGPGFAAAASAPSSDLVSPPVTEPEGGDQDAAANGVVGTDGTLGAAALADENVDAAPADPDDAYAAWRAQHAAWRQQDDAWRRQQQDAARAARDQARRERHAHAATFSAEAAERRRLRRLASPRTPFAYVATVLGVAVIAGALVAITSAAELAGAVGLFVAALVVALGMVVAGVARRRSGFLAVVTLVLLVGGGAAVVLPTLQSQHVLGYSYGISNLTDPPVSTAAEPFVQPWGNLNVYLAATGRPTAPLYIDKADGSTMIRFDPEVALTLDLTAPEWNTRVISTSGVLVDLRDVPGAQVTDLTDGRTRFEVRLATADATTEQTLVLDQRAGWIGLDLPFAVADLATSSTPETGAAE